MLFLWGPVAIYALAIFIESSISQVPAFPSGFTDKDGHGLMYAGLAILIIRALSGAQWSGVGLGVGASAIALAALYGASDEFHQWFVPGRTADVADWIADVIGASIGVAVVLLVALLVMRAVRRRREGLGSR
jgi:VanZ family protein